MTPNTFINSISTLHLALFGGVVIIGILIYFLEDNWVLNYVDTENIFFFMVPIVALGGITFGHILFNSKIDELSEASSLSAKLEGFRAASIIKYALIEGPALIGVIAAMDSGNLLYLFISAGLSIYLLSLRPSKDKIEATLNLNSAMTSQFNRLDQEMR